MSRSRAVSAILLALVFALMVSSFTVFGDDTTLSIFCDAPGNELDLGQAVTITWKLINTTADAQFAGELTRCVKSPSWTSGPCDVLAGGVETSGASPFEVDYFFAPDEAGTYTIEGSYEGCTTCDPELTPAGPAYLYLTVNQAETNTTIASSLDPSEEGEDVTFSATITSGWIGGPAIGGTADFYIDNDPFADTLIGENLTVTAGQATCTYDFSTEGAGSYDIYVVYDGDANYATSTSSSITQEVLAVPVDTTTALTTESPLPTPPGGNTTYLDVGQTVDLVATVTAASGLDDPTGTVDFYGDATYLGTASLETDIVPDLTAEAVLTTSFDSVGSVAVVATYTGVPGEFASSSSGSHTVVVSAADTVATVTNDFPDASVLGQPFQVEGTVSVASPGAGHPTGTVTVEDEAGNSCDAIVDPVAGTWSCVITSDPTTVADTYELRARFDSDDSSFNDSPEIAWGTPGLATHEYTDPTTRTEVMGADTPLIVGDTGTFEVHVVDVPDPLTHPQGTVTVSVAPTGQGTLSSPATRVLDAAGRCTFTYTPTSAATTPHVVTASYNGEANPTPPPDYIHQPSAGTYAQEIVKRAADMDLTLGPTSAYIGQPVTVTVHVEDDTTEGTPTVPEGTVTFDDGGKNGVFGTVTHTAGSGVWNVTYTPAPFDAGATTITATYDGSSVHTGKSAMANLGVELRPIEVYVACSQDALLVSEAYTGCTITVKDVAQEGVAASPLGVISSLTTVLATDGNGSTNSGTYNLTGPTFPSASESRWTFDYLCTGLDPEAEGGYDTITAEFIASDGIHTSTSGAFIQPLMKRYTITRLSGCSSTTTGVTCTVTVEENPDNGGIPVDIAGKIYLEKGDSDALLCTLSPGPSPSCTFSVGSDALLANVTVRYEPTDNVHLASTDSVNVSRADQPEFDPDVPDTPDPLLYDDCKDGCGSGGVDIDQMIFDLNAADVALAAVQMGLEVASIALDLIPDGVVTAGIVVQSGVTIPWSDVAAAIVSGSALALEIARTAMTTDLDGDGLPDVVENTVTHTKYNDTDSDGDGLGDYDEISECGGYYGGTLRPNPNDEDSDDDDLLDGEEVGYNTSFCVADTDCDTVTDGDEVGTWKCGDPRNHADPLVMDTDGDGLDDNLEFSAGPGCNSCPFVNDADSDDDGLQDGAEDWDGNGIITTGTLGGTGARGPASVLGVSGETDFCDPDTDEDGLSDGEEFFLFGGLRPNPDVGQGFVDVPVVGHPTWGLTATNPALDWDSDDDGLNDGEEVNVFQTDPLDWDTDDDTVSDGLEVATWDATIALRLGVTKSTDSRDHANPREDDTDGDGITDDREFAYGCNCGTGTDGYVNDDDSDDDGLQDGREYELFGTGADVAAAGDASLPVPRGNNGELSADDVCCLCDPDSDDDGLSDGEEDHTGTEPLDWDSDNDGLSDLEELQVYFTDPNDPDTDDDTASGILPNRPVECTLAGYTGTQTTISVEGYSVLVYEHIVLASDGEEALSRTGVDPFGELGDQSDPLSKDTDGDGIGDEIEFKPGCNCGVDGGASQDGFVNDADSDDDGLQDGPDSELTDPKGWTDPGDDVDDSDGNNGELGADTTCSLCDPDSDGDGLSDGEEFYTGTNPMDWDSDEDGLSDKEELQTYFTDPWDDDTDDDKADGNIAARDPATLLGPTLPGHSGNGTIAALSDCEEAFSGTSYPPFGGPFDETDPLQVDTDGDGLGDEIEFKVGCSCSTTEWCDCPVDPVGWAYADPNAYDVDYDPMLDGFANSFDSDGDGLRDDLDIGADVDPSFGNDGELDDDDTHSICDYDSDGDGLSDGEEDHTGTDWLDWDSDEDGLSDYEEVRTYFTDPNDDDTDDDQAEGNIAARDPTIEPVLKTDPTDTETTHSGNGTIVTLSDCEEAFSGTSYPPFGNPFDETDPLQVDTDGDGLTDAIEFKVGCSCATTDWCDCPADPGWTYADPNAYDVDYDPIRDGYANSSDSDEDGLRDGEDVHIDLLGSGIDFPGKVFTRRAMYSYPDEVTLREQQDDGMHSICDRDSDGDGLLDGEEFAIGTDWLDWDTDDDGRNDWHEHTGGEQVTNADPIPSDPFDPDTDDDGLLDSAEVFGLNNTNVLNADTDGDGLCDGGTGTPYMMDWFIGDTTVHVNPICKSCAEPGLDACAASVRSGSVDGIGDHPNPHGYGEDKNGDGAWDLGGSDYWGDVYAGDETDPNQYDTDGDADGDGVEVLSFSTSRQGWIATLDIFGRPITVTYPACGCLNPLDPDTDGDQLEDGYEDRNHDGNFDFLPSEFDHQDPLPGPPIPYPTETNPCDPDTDHDELTDYEERYQAQVFEFYALWDNDGDGLYNEDPFVDGIDEDGDGLDGEDPVEPPFNPTNPLDHDTDNDWILDGPEVFWECVALEYWTLDNDTDGLIDEDPIDGIDNDEDGLIDEDPVDYWVRFVPMLDPTNRDSDSDGFIDGLDSDPCNSDLIPLLAEVQAEPIDTDGDGFSDDDELFAGTHPNDPEDHPAAYGMMNLDLDDCFDDRLWLEPAICCGIANSVVIDIGSNVLIDIRVQIVQPRDVRVGDFDGDGHEDDARYVIEYAFALYRVVQRRIVLTIDDFDMDLVIDAVRLDQK